MGNVIHLPKPLVGCLILVRNGVASGLERCLESIQAAGMTPIVLDDESVDDTYLTCQRFGAIYRYHSAPGRRENEIWQTTEHDLRHQLARFAMDHQPTILATLDADEWYMSPLTVKQIVAGMLRYNQYDTVLFKTVNFWGDEAHVKTFPHDPNYARPRIWRVEPDKSQEPVGGLICTQAPDYVMGRRCSHMYNILVGHTGYIKREVRFAKAKRYVQLGAGQWAREFLSEHHVHEWVPGEQLAGLP
jgi:glycosyltransferase involved in cell wall biosynthesis